MIMMKVMMMVMMMMMMVMMIMIMRIIIIMVTGVLKNMEILPFDCYLNLLVTCNV